jgi:hypothetical protein
MSTDSVPTTMQDRREVWLQIALAVARDGLAEPKDLSFFADGPDDRPFSDGLPYGCITLEADTAEQAALWAAWAGLTSPPKLHENTAGTFAAHTGGKRARGGWFWFIRGRVVTPPAGGLAAEVVAAIEPAVAQ